MSYPKTRARRARWSWTIATVVAVSGCMSIAAHLKDACDYLDKNCLIADSKEATHDLSGGGGLDKANITVKIVNKVKYTFTKLRLKKPKPKDHSFQPTLGIAVDPTYAGLEQLAVDDLVMCKNGVDIASTSDAKAKAVLDEKLKGAKWSVVRSIVPVVTGVEATDFTITGALRLDATLTNGKKFDPSIPCYIAARDSDTNAFVIRKLTFDVDGGAFSKPVFPIVDAAAFDSFGVIKAPAGADYTLPRLFAFNNTGTSFAGKMRVYVTRSGVTAPSLYDTPIGMESYKSFQAQNITLAIKQLPAGDYWLDTVIEDGAKKVISSSRCTLQLTGNAPPIACEAISSQISAGQGGTATLWIRGGNAYASASFVMLLSKTPALIGTNLSGIQLPFTFDELSTSSLELMSSIWQNGVGTLDIDGFAKTTLVLPAGLDSLVGLRLYAAPVVMGSHWSSSAAPAEVTMIK